MGMAVQESVAAVLAACRSWYAICQVLWDIILPASPISQGTIKTDHRALQLAAADKNANSRLLDLPAEVRERIYDFAFDDRSPFVPSAKFQIRPLDPPLTYVCRMVREESLPLFYSEYRLTIQTLVHGHPRSKDGIQLGTMKWYHKLPQDKMRHIQNLKLRSWIKGSSPEGLMEFDIRLNRRVDSYSIGGSVGSGLLSVLDEENAETLVTAVREHLTITLDALVEHPGIGNFTAADLDRLVDDDGRVHLRRGELYRTSNA